MKTILVPTDFTITASNAVFYAAELATVFRAKLVLVHVCHVRGVTPILAEKGPNAAEMEDDAQIGMNSLVERLVERYEGKLNLETQIVWGSPPNQIRKLIKDLEADLVVMGVRESNFLTTKWDDSSVKSLYRKAGCPVLGVKHHSAFHTIKNVLIAYDGDIAINPETRDMLQDLQDRLSPIFHVATVSNNPISDEFVKSDAERHFSQNMPNLNYKFYLRHSDDVLGELRKLAVDCAADIVIMLPHSHFSLPGLLKGTQSDKMVLEGDIPVLTLFN